MKYRDLMFVVCLIAMGSLYWASPQVSEERHINSKTARSLATETSAPNGSGEQASYELDLTIKKQGEKTHYLVIGVKLTAHEELNLQVDEDGIPLSSLALSAAGHYSTWPFESTSKIDSRKILKPSESLSWDISLSKLSWKGMKSLPDLDRRLEELYRRQPLTAIVQVHNEEGDQPPFDDRPTIVIMDSIQIPPYHS